MTLVTYSDSDDSERDDTACPKTTLKRKRNSDNEEQSGLPPLPDGFHNLYTSNARISKHDDPDLHAGRQRQIPHMEGQWPTHVYIEWHPSRNEIEALNKILNKVQRILPSNTSLHSLLKSELGADQPLHISLSRTLMLVMEERQPFINDLQAVIKASNISPFTVGLGCFRWVSNYEKNRWFLVVQIEKPVGDELNKLLEASNEVARKHKQPCLYVSQEDLAPSSPMLITYQVRGSSSKRRRSFAHSGTRRYSQRPQLYEDASAHFHISIGWTLERPSEDLIDDGVVGQELMIKVQAIKVKIGNGLAVITLASKSIESNGIIGL